MSILIIATSLNPASRSQILAQSMDQILRQKGQACETIDMRQFPLPFCDGDKAYGDKNVGLLKQKIESAAAILLASPIYNFDLNAVAKNLMELTGKAWTNKTVGFLCAAGGGMSYMSAMSFANSLMLDFRCQIISRYVYVTAKDFQDGEIANPDVAKRIGQLADEAIRLKAH